MSQHACSNCRRVLTATVALTEGGLCDKCAWAAGAELFRDEAPTRPRISIPRAVLVDDSSRDVITRDGR